MVHVEAAANALPISHHLSSRRSSDWLRAVMRPIKATATNLTSPDLASLLQELLTRQHGWQPGTGCRFCFVRHRLCQRQRVTATGKVVAFDSSGYSFDPASDLPTEWRHFRRHRFAQLHQLPNRPSFRHGVRSRACRREDNADAAAADQNINFTR